jgi:hypothetical protein
MMMFESNAEAQSAERERESVSVRERALQREREKKRKRASKGTFFSLSWTHKTQCSVGFGSQTTTMMLYFNSPKWVQECGEEQFPYSIFYRYAVRRSLMFILVHHIANC